MLIKVKVIILIVGSCLDESSGNHRLIARLFFVSDSDGKRGEYT